MPETPRLPHPLVAHLVSLAEREDRASLAKLRGALRAGRELDALPFVMPFLSGQSKDGSPYTPTVRERREDDAILLASLFALHPEDGPLSLGKALKFVLHDTKSESIEGRFRALLSAGRADLAPHLRHAVSLVASKQQPIDWSDLYRAIRSWDHEDATVRRAWARDFWAGAAFEGAPTPIASVLAVTEMPAT